MSRWYYWQGRPNLRPSCFSRGAPSEGERAQCCVLRASGVGLKHDQTAGRIIAAGGIELHGVQTAGCIRRATGVIQQNLKASGSVVIADRVAFKRGGADGGVVRATGIIKERLITAGGVIVPANIEVECTDTSNSVLGAGSIMPSWSWTTSSGSTFSTSSATSPNCGARSGSTSSL